MNMKHDAPEIDWEKIAEAVKSAGFTVAEVMAAFEKWRKTSEGATPKPSTVRVDKFVPLPALVTTLARERGDTTIMMIELRHNGPKDLEAMSFVHMNNRDCDALTVLEAVVACLRETHNQHVKMYALECLKRGVVPRGDGGV